MAQVLLEVRLGTGCQQAQAHTQCSACMYIHGQPHRAAPAGAPTASSCTHIHGSPQSLNSTSQCCAAPEIWPQALHLPTSSSGPCSAWTLTHPHPALTADYSLSGPSPWPHSRTTVGPAKHVHREPWPRKIVRN